MNNKKELEPGNIAASPESSSKDINNPNLVKNRDVNEIAGNNKSSSSSRAKKEKKKKWHIMKPEYYEEVHDKLSKAYPKLFNKEEVRLLKVGIKEELLESDTEVSKTKIRKFLKLYTEKADYRKKHKAGEKRYDLFGNEAGKVTKEQEEDVTKKLQELKAAREAKEQKMLEKKKQRKQEKFNKGKKGDKQAGKPANKLSGDPNKQKANEATENGNSQRVKLGIKT